MGRKPLQLTEEEKTERLRLQKKKYDESKKGKERHAIAIKKYQDSEEYREKKRKYMRKKREEQANA